MVVPASHRLSRGLWYSGYRFREGSISSTGLSPSLDKPSSSFDYTSSPKHPSHNPRGKTLWFGLVRVRSPLLPESLLFSFPTGTKMVQFPAFACMKLCIHFTILRIGEGCPIRKSPDQSPLGGSPRLIAACRVLHRFSIPRHPPCALSLLANVCHLRLLLALYLCVFMKLSKIEKLKAFQS